MATTKKTTPTTAATTENTTVAKTSKAAPVKTAPVKTAPAKAAKTMPAKKAAPKKTVPKKPTPKKPVAKTAAPSQTSIKMFVEFGGTQVSIDKVIEDVKATYGKDAKEITVYLKPEESKAYFVADGEEMDMDVFFC